MTQGGFVMKKINNYNDYNNENNCNYPVITEKFASKLQAEKAAAPALSGTPAEISAAIRAAMAKHNGSIITVSPAAVRAAVAAELDSRKCA